MVAPKTAPRIADYSFDLSPPIFGHTNSFLGSVNDNIVYEFIKDLVPLWIGNQSTQKLQSKPGIRSSVVKPIVHLKKGFLDTSYC